MRNLFRLLLASLIAAVWTCTPYPLNTVDKEIAVGIKDQNAVHWRPSINASMWESKRSRKPVALYVHLDGCSFCNELNNRTFIDSDIVKLLNDEFIPIWMNAEYNAENILSLGVEIFPTIVILTPDGIPISKLEGFFTPEELKFALEEVSEYVQDLEQKSYGQRPRLRISLRPGTYRL